MAGNTMSIEFAGDAAKLQKAGKDSEQAVEGVGTAATKASDDFKKSAGESSNFTDKIGKLGAGVSGMTDAIDSAGAATQALADLQSAGRERAARLARAQADVEQAMIDQKQAAVDLEQATLDLSQAQIDGKQAAVDETQAVIDRKQALLDADTAMDNYNTAVKEHGKGSAEAKQALIDLAQANNDVKQANVDLTQAQADATQATIDGKQAAVDGTQAVRDGKDAQLDLNDAMSEANPSGLQKWADNIQMVTPVLSGLVGVVGLVTAAQWAWNAAQLASPTTWIIAAIVLLIGVIVLIATKTTWFQDLWRVVWGGIKDAAAAVGSWFKDVLWGKWIKGAWGGIVAGGNKVWSWMKALPGRIKDAFSGLVGIITWPYRTAFNLISSAWNNTVGRLSWTIPGWVPGIGGNSISAPHLPKFHSGGTVPGIPGQEVPIMALAGETVSARGASGGGGETVYVRGDALIDMLIEMIAREVGRRGGNAQLVLGGRNA